MQQNCQFISSTFSIPYFSDVIFPVDEREAGLYLEPLAATWRELGAQLHIPDATLSEIEQHHHEDVEESLKEVVRRWLKHAAPSPCWGTLVEALQELHMNKISTRITTNHGKES